MDYVHLKMYIQYTKMYTLNSCSFFLVLIIFYTSNCYLYVALHWCHLLEIPGGLEFVTVQVLKDRQTHYLCSYKVSYRCMYPDPKEAGPQPKIHQAWSQKRHNIPRLSCLFPLSGIIWMDETLDCIYLRKHAWSLCVKWQSDLEVEDGLVPWSDK
jgi:hypothetical protein